MPDSFSDQLDEHHQAAAQLARNVLKRAEGAGLAISDEIRRESLALLRKIIRAGATPHEVLVKFLHEFRGILQKYEPIFAQTVSDAQLASYLEGGHGVLRTLIVPEHSQSLLAYLERLRSSQGIPEPPAWTQTLVLPPADAEAVVHFPIIEEAARDMVTHGILTPATLEAAHQIARMDGFAAGRTGALNAMERVRDALVEAVVDGDSLSTFRAKIADAIDTSKFSERAQAALFRNVIMRSYARGQKEVVSQPLVKSVARFCWRSEIQDSRLTDLCRELSRSGLPDMNGKRTAIFFVEDPVWAIVAPSSHPLCRCSSLFLTVKRAAEKGIAVARKWHESGIMPPFEELCVPYPDLSGIPEPERRQFSTWVSPWAA